MSHVIDESYSLYNETPRRARTAKACDACKRTIAVGEIYMRVAWVLDRRADSANRCGACQTTHKHLRGLDSYGETWPDERLGCGEDYEEEWGGAPPEEIAALPFTSGREASSLLEETYASERETMRHLRGLRKAAKKC